MRWIPTGLCMVVALVSMFASFFYPHFHWLLFVGFVFVFIALGVNLGVAPERPEDNAVPPRHDY